LKKNYISFLNKNLNENFFKIFINYFKQVWVFKKIYNIEFKNKVPTTYFFLTDYEKNHLKYNRNLLRILKGTIFEIGHHIDAKYLKKSLLKKDISKFGKYKKWMIGARVHTLKFKIFNLLELLNHSSYSYDSSLCFPEGIGYRTGFSYPHKIYDSENKTEFDTLVIPLNVMDTTLFDFKYIKSNDEDSKILLNNFINNNIKYGGVLTILFHHTFFWLNTSNRIQFFDQFLSKLSKEGVGFYTLRDVNIWYNSFKSNLIMDEN
jgi:hypothetical protein